MRTIHFSGLEGGARFNALSLSLPASFHLPRSDKIHHGLRALAHFFSASSLAFSSSAWASAFFLLASSCA